MSRSGVMYSVSPSFRSPRVRVKVRARVRVRVQVTGGAIEMFGLLHWYVQ